MRIFLTKPAQKQLEKLPEEIKKKIRKQLQFFQKDIYHPSLRFKKLSGTDYYEIRVDYHYRLSGRFKEDDFFILAIGMHDSGLGKK